MYPTVNETDHDHVYAANNHSHPPQGYVLQMPSYGIPQPYPPPPPPYISNSSRAIPRTHHWSTGLCRCLDDPGICKNHVVARFIHSPFFKTVPYNDYVFVLLTRFGHLLLPLCYFWIDIRDSR